MMQISSFLWKLTSVVLRDSRSEVDVVWMDLLLLKLKGNQGGSSVCGINPFGMSMS